MCDQDRADGANPTPTARFTVIRYPGQLVGKEFRADDQGRAVSRTDGNAHQGWFEVKSVSSMTALAATLDGLQLEELFVHGVPNYDYRDGYVIAGGARVPSFIDEAETLVISRTKEDLTEPEVAICTLDSDFDWAPDWTQFIQNPEQHHSFLTGVVPELAGAGVVVRPSSSTGIVNADGTPYKRTRNFHTHFMCLGEERVAIMERLRDLFAARGYGWIMLNTAGGMLERSPVDLALRTTNQPVYAAPPRVLEPVRSKRPAPLVQEGRLLRLADLPEVSDADVVATYEALKADPDLLAQQASIKEAYADKKARERLVLQPNPTEEQLETERKKVRQHMAAAERARLDGEKLPLDYVIRTIGFGDLTVEELVANPTRYHEVKTCDPMEPEYRGGAQTGILYLRGRVPMCVSLAHGVSTKYLLATPTDPTPEFRERVQRLLEDKPALDVEVLSPMGPQGEMEPRAAKDALRSTVARWFKHGGRIGVRATMGLGKTTLVMELMAQEEGRYFLVLSPTVENAKQAYRDYVAAGGTDGYVFLGRNQPDPDRPGSAMCLDPEHAARNLKLGDREKSLCLGCARFRKCGCGYDRQREMIKRDAPRVIFTVHEFAHLPLPEGWEPHAVIIDETLRNGGVDMGIGVPWKELIGLNHEDLDQVEKYLERHLQTRPNDLTIDGIYEHKMKTLVLEGLLEGKRLIPFGDMMVIGQKLPYRYADLPTLVLDGTLRKSLTEMYLGPLDEMVEVRAKRNYDMMQVLGNKFAKDATLSKPALLEDMRAKMADYDFKVLDKKVREKMGLMSDPSVGHIGAIRGKNEWEDAGSCIILTYAQPNIAALVAVAEVLLGEKVTGDVVEETNYINLRGGGRVATKTHNHTNHVVAELVRSVREDELVQAIDRLRLVWHEGAPKVIVLCSPVATELEADAVCTWDEFKVSRYDKTLMRLLTEGDCIAPDSARQAALRRPDVFRSYDTAKRHYRRWDQNWRSQLKRVEIADENGVLSGTIGWRLP